MGEFLVEQTLFALDSAKSPVQGESFPALSRKYKKRKLAEGGRGIPDLELTGDLKADLTASPAPDGLEIGFFGSQADKADGHLKFSDRENNCPQRRFLPGEGQKFKREIESGVEDIIARRSGEAFKEEDFADVESKADLYDVLSEVYLDMSRSEIRQAVASSPDLFDLLSGLDLIGLL